jgi:hypothetical protein
MSAAVDIRLPAHQAHWTRLGVSMGYTHTEPQRAQLRTALDDMAWVDPGELGGILDAAPIRYVVAGLFFGRAWALHRAAVTPLPADGACRGVRLIGLESAAGDRYLLVDTGYEALDVLHENTVHVGAVGGCE